MGCCHVRLWIIIGNKFCLLRDSEFHCSSVMDSKILGRLWLQTFFFG
jgi:hypothetical protein